MFFTCENGVLIVEAKCDHVSFWRFTPKYRFNHRIKTLILILVIGITRSDLISDAASWDNPNADKTAVYTYQPQRLLANEKR